MCDSVKEQIYKAFLDYYSLAQAEGDGFRKIWVMKHISQAISTVSMIVWTTTT